MPSTSHKKTTFQQVQLYIQTPIKKTTIALSVELLDVQWYIILFIYLNDPKHYMKSMNYITNTAC